MIESIMAKGFIAISAYMYVFALLALILFIVAIIANAFLSRIDLMSRKSENSF